MTNYYARVENGPLHGPFPDHDAAIADLSRRLAGSTGGASGLQILLDLGSVCPTEGDQLAHLLRTDPLLRAVFELGRRHHD